MQRRRGCFDEMRMGGGGDAAVIQRERRRESTCLSCQLLFLCYFFQIQDVKVFIQPYLQSAYRLFSRARAFSRSVFIFITLLHTIERAKVCYSPNIHPPSLLHHFFFLEMISPFPSIPLCTQIMHHKYNTRKYVDMYVGCVHVLSPT